MCIAAVSIITGSWCSRKTRIQPAAMTFFDVRHEVALLLKLGFAFMASGFLVMGAAYAARIIVARNVGLEAAGFYSAAWTLGGLYVGFVLQPWGRTLPPAGGRRHRQRMAFPTYSNERRRSTNSVSIAVGT
jgi:PST family polysaccharide transporter